MFDLGTEGLGDQKVLAKYVPPLVEPDRGRGGRLLFVPAVTSAVISLHQVCYAPGVNMDQFSDQIQAGKGACQWCRNKIAHRGPFP